MSFIAFNQIPKSVLNTKMGGPMLTQAEVKKFYFLFTSAWVSIEPPIFVFKTDLGIWLKAMNDIWHYEQNWGESKKYW